LGGFETVGGDFSLQNPHRDLTHHWLLNKLGCSAAVLTGTLLGLSMTGCGGGGANSTPPRPTITSVTVSPNPAAATIGTTLQFTASVAGTGSFSQGVTWSVFAPSSSTLSAGTITAGGLYTTPYPAPDTVNVVATSTEDSTKSGSVTVTLSPPTVAAGPVLTVDAGNRTHVISPYIYGMNAYLLDAATAKATNITIDRWGGDSTSRYNYLLDVTSDAADWYFENAAGTSGDGGTAVSGVSAFDALVTSNNSLGVKTLGTVPVQGWVAKDSTSCSFPASTYPSQYAFAPDNSDCGDGELPNQTDITGNSPTVTSTAVGPSWAGDWVTYLVGKFGTAANGGVAIYDLDNEPSWWDAVHRDVHPSPFTYDEVTNNGIATALAVKTADPAAEVSGPVMDYWWDYFYSKKDVESGWGTGPCYEPWSNPADRNAHGGIAFIEYYLQQFAAYEAGNSVRLLDYLDLHTYFAADYPAGGSNSVAFTTAGDTSVQQARLNSTRVFWDPNYTDPNYTQPNYTTDSNYSASCTPPVQAPQLIPMMQKWIASDYPGTKLAIDEYNWGGMEAINGALAQADILGIFGSYGLDLGTMWPTTSPSAQGPGMMAFAIYRNYDGANSTFGDTALSSASGNQGALSVYGALRTTDNAVTVVVINKTYGDLTDTLSLANVAPSGSAQSFLYSNANLAAIVAQPAVPVTPPAAGSTTSTLSTTFPAQSITLLVVPQT
jgi:Glycoside hydrolase family 44